MFDKLKYKYCDVVDGGILDLMNADPFIEVKADLNGTGPAVFFCNKIKSLTPNEKMNLIQSTVTLLQKKYNDIYREQVYNEDGHGTNTVVEENHDPYDQIRRLREETYLPF